MPASKVAPCPDCGHLVSPQAEACPSCGHPFRSPAAREGLFLRTMNQATALVTWGPVFLLGVLVVVALIARVLFFH